MNATSPSPQGAPNTTLIDPLTDAELRAADAAGPVTDADRARADALLRSILVSDPVTAPRVPVRQKVTSRPAARWAAAAAAAVLVGGAAFVAQAASAPLASATWTATPSEVSSPDLALAERACRATSEGNDPGRNWFDSSTLTMRLAERRGDWIAVLLTGPGADPAQTPETSVSCLAQLPPGAGSVGDLQWGASGGGGFAAPRGQDFFEGAMSQFAIGSSWLEDGEPVSFVDGRLGPDVTGLTIHSQGVSVEASIKDGTYAAWWPGRAFPDAPLPPSGEGGPQPTLTYDVTLRDGTVLTNVAPATPTS